MTSLTRTFFFVLLSVCALVSCNSRHALEGRWGGKECRLDVAPQGKAFIEGYGTSAIGTWIVLDERRIALTLRTYGQDVSPALTLNSDGSSTMSGAAFGSCGTLFRQ